ncbi:MAG: class I SAM-dependent methyltransferase [Candidatus Hydrogenedentes bacterium]|nr:class I SAM-dependent methyltransferase [Candidatus Hydrogenedentota bacterium]
MPIHPLLVSRRIEVQIIKRMLKFTPDDVVCDIGCGDGYWTSRITRSARTVGVDIDSAALRRAVAIHSRPRLTYVKASVTDMPFPTDYFTRIFGICSIEHVPDNTAAFSEMGRCLRPGGLLALTLDSLTFPGTTQARREEHHRKYFTPHLYDVPYAAECLQSAGLTLVEHQFIICSPSAHRAYNLVSRQPKLQYLGFPILYPLIRWSDARESEPKGGWKLAIKAIKKV